MRPLVAAAFAVLLAPCAHAEVEASLDLRLVQSDGRDSYMDGGLGKLRYDSDDDGLQLGRARLAWRGSPGGDWHANVDLSAWSLDDHNAIDVTEAWLEWRPVPTSPWRSNLKIGAFYPPISLEHRAPGWTNPYTISSSALNTWVGEELRTIGVAYGLDHLGIADGGRFDYGAQVAVFGWNDPAGVIVAYRGFSLNDRQTPLFGRIGTYAFGDREQRVLFSEIDHRPGYHASAYLTHDSGLELRALRYDNRADPGDYKASISDYAWRTKFDSLGARYDGPGGLAIITQWLKGETYVDEPSSSWNFETAFLLVAREFGRHRLAARYDDFHVHPGLQPNYPLDPESGHAVTVDWTWKFNEHVQLMAEWMQIDSRFNNRLMLGEDPAARERIVQLSLLLSL